MRRSIREPRDQRATDRYRNARRQRSSGWYKLGGGHQHRRSGRGRETLRKQGLLKRVERILHAITNQIEAMAGGAQRQAFGRRRSQRLQSAHVVRTDDPQEAVVTSCVTAAASAEDFSKLLKRQ